MTGGWSSDIHRVDVRILDKFRGVGVPFGNPVPFGIHTCSQGIAPHHGHDVRALDVPEGRSRLQLGHLTTSYKAPSNLFHAAKLVQTEDNTK